LPDSDKRELIFPSPENGVTPAEVDTAVRERPRGTPRFWVAAIVLAISIGAVYGRALNAPFIFDDDGSILQNASIQSLWPLWGTLEQPGPLRPAADLPTAGRPLVNLTLAINYHFGALNPIGYHLFNVVLHFLAAVLLWAIVRRTLRLPYFNGRFDTAADWLALGVALLWALHPLQTEAVIYVTQRTELMMAVCYLATLYCSLRYWSVLPSLLEGGQVAGDSPWRGDGTLDQTRLRRQRATWLFMAIVACAFGMASKEVMISAPLVVLLFERTFVAGSLANAFRRSWPLYAGLTAAAVLLVALSLNAPRSQSAGFHLGLPLPTWWATQCKVLLMYLKLVIWPAPLLLHYELPYLNSFADAAIYVIPVALLALIALVLLWRNSPLGFLLVASAAILAPTSIVPLPTEMAAERRMYLPLAALVTLFVVGGYLLIQRYLKRKSRDAEAALNTRSKPIVIALPVLLLVVLFGVVSAMRLVAYNDPIRLWQHVVQHQPNNYTAHYNLGMMLNQAGREAESFAELQAAVAANPNSANARSAFGFALMSAGRLPEAAESLQAALAIDPDHVGALNNMGRLFILLERNSKAISHLQHALQKNPNHADAHHNLGKALANVGQTDAAIEELRTALRLTPNDVDVLMSLGTVLTFANRNAEAIEALQQAVALRPNYAGARNSLGIAMFRAGSASQAIEQFRRFIELDPNNVAGYCNLGNIFAAQGDYKQAIPLYEQAIAMHPKVAEGHFSLAVALAETGRPAEAIEHFETGIRLNNGLVPADLSLARSMAKAPRSEEAIRAAKKGIEDARSAGDTAVADQLEVWLKTYQAESQAAEEPSANVPTK
jgi:protein O-mannosyl-transferase